MNEPDRLRNFWNSRYVEFSLRESGIKTLNARFSELLYRCKRQAYLRAVSASGLDRNPHLAILDGGCGQGFFAEVVRQALPGATYMGLDISEKAIAFLRNRYPQYNWQCCDLADPKLNIGGVYDLAQSIEVLHLIIDDAHHNEALANLSASVHSGGVMVVTDTLPRARYMANSYIVFRPLDHYQRQCAQLGLSVENVFPMYYCIPDGGPGPSRIRRLWRFAPPGLVYAFDRTALSLRLPQWRQSHDSQMKMLVLRKTV